MHFKKTPIQGLFVIEHEKLQDDRGFFSRTFCKKMFLELGFSKDFVQCNHSFNKEKGTLRGMHYQNRPFCEAKLIRCIQGAVFDVAIDLRTNSPTFLQYFGVELTSDNLTSIFIPEGFAHGFQTLVDNSSLIYHHSEYYVPGADAGIRHDDPKLDIKWPLLPNNLSKKDHDYKLIDKDFKGL